VLCIEALHKEPVGSYQDSGVSSAVPGLPTGARDPASKSSGAHSEMSPDPETHFSVQIFKTLPFKTAEDAGSGWRVPIWHLRRQMGTCDAVRCGAVFEAAH
jgi:hypothetical protein